MVVAVANGYQIVLQHILNKDIRTIISVSTAAH